MLESFPDFGGWGGFKFPLVTGRQTGVGGASSVACNHFVLNTHIDLKKIMWTILKNIIKFLVQSVVIPIEDRTWMAEEDGKCAHTEEKDDVGPTANQIQS